jgi:hypothetical protein
MTKWFLYIVLVAMLAPGLSSAKIFSGNRRSISNSFTFNSLMQHDTATVTKGGKHQSDEDKKKIKEIAKAKKLPKPEKVESVTDATKTKPKRQRRPEGLERPPEIPRRNN